LLVRRKEKPIGWIYLPGILKKKIRPDRNPARFKIQYPMKNHTINAGLLFKLYQYQHLPTNFLKLLTQLKNSRL
jgi:hypothetical protein